MQLGDSNAWTLADGRRRPNRLFDSLRTTQSAARAAGQIASLLQQRGKTFRDNADPDFERTVLAEHFHRLDFVGPLHQRFAEREAHSQVFEIGRRGQHDDMRYALIGQRNRLLFGYLIDDVLDPAVDPAPHMNHAEQRRRTCSRRVDSGVTDTARSYDVALAFGQFTMTLLPLATAASLSRPARPSPCTPDNWSPSPSFPS